MSVTDTSASIHNAATPMEMLCINTIRTLSMDAVQAANSGHPGTPMAMAPLAYCLWQEFLRYDPSDPLWPNRDRFVLSAGHASMLLYSVLHLAGVKEADKNTLEILNGPAVRLEDIKNFRQLGSRCAGHPESHLTTGVETTTGPLGQGYANSVGMALAGRWLASRYNQPGFEDIYNFNVYALGGDGCMMEGISSEAASLAGHLKLSNLCWIYDSNRITIEGGTPLAFSEDVAARFAAYGWNVTHVTDANDLDMIRAGFRTFLQNERPADAHHREQPHRLGLAAQAGHRRRARRGARRRGSQADQAGLRLARGREIPDSRRRLRTFPEGNRRPGKTDPRSLDRAIRRVSGEVSRTGRRNFAHGASAASRMDGTRNCRPFQPTRKGLATRDSSAKVENAIAKNVPWLIGGSADLAPSTKTLLTFEAATGFQAGNYSFRNLHFGIREHAMSAIDQRHEPDQGASLRRHLFRVHRLHARRHAAERDHGNSGHLCSDA